MKLIINSNGNNMILRSLCFEMFKSQICTSLFQPKVPNYNIGQTFSDMTYLQPNGDNFLNSNFCTLGNTHVSFHTWMFQSYSTLGNRKFTTASDVQTTVFSKKCVKTEKCIYFNIYLMQKMPICPLICKYSN